MSKISIDKRIEYTQLKLSITSKEIKKIVDLAAKRNYRSVVLSFPNIRVAKNRVANKKYDLKVVTVFGFPSDSYNYSIISTLKNDFDELDMVLPIQQYYYSYPPYLDKIKKFIIHVKRQLTENIIKNNKKIITQKPLKLIIETSLMRSKVMQIKELCKLAKECGVDVIKTNTGLIKRNKPEDLLEDIQLIKKYWNKDIKASGGIKDLEYAKKLIALGASYIGTSTDILAPQSNIIKNE